MDYASVYRNSRSVSIGSYDAYRELDETSSFDLLRSSILHSIRKRNLDTQGFLENTYNGSETNQSLPSGPKYTIVEVEHFNRKDSLPLDDADSDISDTEKNTSHSEKFKHVKEQESSNDINLKNLNISSFKPPDPNSTSEKTSESDLKMYEVETDESTVQTESIANSLKLAQRNLNDTIFKDCSTYDISCGTIDLEGKKNYRTRSLGSVNHSMSSASSSSENFSSISSVKENSFVNNIYQLGEHLDDKSSLSDTFFPTIIDDETPSQSMHFHQTLSNCTENRSSLIEKDHTADEDLQEEATNESSTLPSKRKFSRRHRKRNRRKNKSRKSYVYECSKCGVSFIIPTKAMNNLACCLHCDLWTPVEPVFVKSEKQTWNTCTIC